jgi:hypothetical protein
MSLKHWLFGALLVSLTALPAAAQEGEGDVIYVPTPQNVVDEMLRMAKVGPADFIIDLGSGDGRIVITAAKSYGAHGLGVDLDKFLLNRARENARAAGVADKVKFVEQDLFETDLSQATVISSYLLPEMNVKLRPKLLALKPGTRIVTHDYDIGEGFPDERKTMIVPEKEVGDGKSYIYSYVVPASVAGKWETLIDRGTRSVKYEFDFVQIFQKVGGQVRVDGKDERLPPFKIKGDHMEFEIDLPQGGAKLIKHRFQGRIGRDTIEGTLAIGKQKPQAWKATIKTRGEMYKGAPEVPGGKS